MGLPSLPSFYLGRKLFIPRHLPWTGWTGHDSTCLAMVCWRLELVGFGHGFGLFVWFGKRSPEAAPTPMLPPLPQTGTQILPNHVSEQFVLNT